MYYAKIYASIINAGLPSTYYIHSNHTKSYLFRSSCLLAKTSYITPLLGGVIVAEHHE